MRTSFSLKRAEENSNVKQRPNRPGLTMQHFDFRTLFAIFCTNCGNVEVLLIKQFLTLLYCTRYHWFHSFGPSLHHSFIRSFHSSLCRSISLNAVIFMYTWESHDSRPIQSGLSSLMDWPISTQHDTWWPFHT